MNLPEDDELFLEQKEVKWRLVEGQGGRGLLLIPEYAVNAGKYDRDSTDLLIHIPPQYNMAQLDMWYVDPPLKLKSNGDFPDRAATMENYLDRTWQRFSRHLPSGAWRSGIDGLPMFFTFINRELR
jgi:hypothetical protein